ncbi:MAG TPA: hypothetical protein VM869_16845 [Enhygromyxa sp.]|nr:hypothetical protein [Enhygromyxa sp.]
MTTSTVGALFDRVVNVLEALMHGYESLAREFEHRDPLAPELAAFLAKRERETVAALAEYRAVEHPLALDVHVRLSSGFPFSNEDLTIPAQPTIDGLAELARRTDYLLEHLSERIQIYAASRPLAEILAALEQLVASRRRQLAGALNEFQEFERTD